MDVVQHGIGIRYLELLAGLYAYHVRFKKTANIFEHRLGRIRIEIHRPDPCFDIDQNVSQALVSSEDVVPCRRRL